MEHIKFRLLKYWMSVLHTLHFIKVDYSHYMIGNSSYIHHVTCDCHVTETFNQYPRPMDASEL